MIPGRIKSFNSELEGLAQLCPELDLIGQIGESGRMFRVSRAMRRTIPECCSWELMLNFSYIPSQYGSLKWHNVQILMEALWVIHSIT